MVMCRTCGERPCLPSRLKRTGERICSRCLNGTPRNIAAKAKYRASEGHRVASLAQRQRDNPRRIWIGQSYHSSASSVEEAQRINAHTRERLSAFKRQQAGA